MGAIVGLFYLTFMMMLQSAIFSRLPLLSGTADIVFLTLIAWALQDRVKAWEVWFWTIFAAVFTSFISAAPTFAMLVPYLLVILMVRWIQHRIWQASIWALLFSIVVGTLFQQTTVLMVLKYFNNVPLEVSESFIYVILPSMVLNLLFAIPVYLLIKDLADWLYPVEVE